MEGCWSAEEALSLRDRTLGEYRALRADTGGEARPSLPHPIAPQELQLVNPG
jgi:hypothetical protein